MMRRGRMIALAAAAAALFGSGTAPAAQSGGSGDETRGLIPREYAKKLETTVTGRRPRKPGRKRPKAVYAPAAKGTGMIPAGGGEDVGVTFWRLRPALPGEGADVVEVQRIAKRVKGSVVETDQKMTPERVVAEAPLGDGDLVRLSIEVPFAGYIYLLNREQYADGTLSEPFLIYPSREDVDKYGRSAPGRLVFIPNEPYRFEITRISGLHDDKTKVAEVFTAILSEQLIPELGLLEGDEPYHRLDPTVVERLNHEWGADTWRFDMQGSAGRPITGSERASGKSVGEPLGDGDPPPQTVYHVARKPGAPLLFTMTVPIRR